MSKIKKMSMNLPVDLLRSAQRASGARSKTEAVVLGLRQLLYRKMADELLAVQGGFGLTQKQLRDGRRR